MNDQHKSKKPLNILSMSLVFATAVFVMILMMNPSFLPSTLGQSDDTQNISNMTDTGESQETLGNLFYTENTQSSGMRVIDVNINPIVEISYTGNSTIGNSSTQTIGTVESTMDYDGVIHSNGKAIITSQNGQVITYTSISKGQYNADGSFSDSGMMIFNLPFQSLAAANTTNTATNSNSANQNDLSEFDDKVGVYKKTVDRFGNGITEVWEWK